jgi:hypothetical protein
VEKPKGQFPDLARRMADYARGSLPAYHPAARGLGEEQGQRAFYEWVQSVYDTFSRQPELWAGKPAADDCYAHPWSNEGRQQVVTAMRKLIGKMDDAFIRVMELALAATENDGTLLVSKDAFKLTAAGKKLLTAMGFVVEEQGTAWAVTCPGREAMMPTLAMMARESRQRDGQRPYTFTRCLFDREYPYLDGTFRQMSGDGAAYDRLLGYLREKGYRRGSLRDGRITVDWTMDYGKKPEPVKDSWGEREHAGIALEYKYAVQRPFFCGLRIPRYRQLLEGADGMPDQVRAMVCDMGKKCDGCGYCTQTDKTGERPRSLVQVEHGGKSYALCTLFPGFHFWYDVLDEERVNRIIELLDYIQDTLKTGPLPGA